MAFVSFLVQRCAKGLLVLLAIAVINFFLIRLAPGDPAQVMAGEAGVGDEVFLQQLRSQFGLDRPLLEQLWLYIRGIISFDLGFSYRQQQAVLDLIVERIPATILLTGTALLISCLLGTFLGILAAQRVGSWLDSAITAAALLVFASPLFWIALMAILLFSVQLEWLPSFGRETVGANFTGFWRAVDIGRHLLLPAMTLALYFAAIYARMMRASMLEVSRLDHVKTAHAKGLPNRLVVRRHIVRNALLPVITLSGLQAGQLIGGAVLTETVFAWPGIGRLMFEALSQRDYSLLLGIFFVSSAMVVVLNVLTDVIYGFVDPRIDIGS